ncbi:hypothetical protein SKAU_G00235110 [Synaphobranchus kaupii]|uniref:Uncharacterized protein n=1 Tax=Synaphobranchus kaupii TaxID=118154 RepID=A0A9Q1F6L8_SYNKA|nr:hypothetical protein SKAU_G00235110 [Synaphobranchus kaupii]
MTEQRCERQAAKRERVPSERSDRWGRGARVDLRGAGSPFRLPVSNVKRETSPREDPCHRRRQPLPL